MLTQFQVWNRKDLMLPNGSIKSLSRSEKMFSSIIRSIKNMLTQFQVRNRNDLMLPNGSIKYLSRSDKTFGSIRGSIKKYSYTVSSAEL